MNNQLGRNIHPGSYQLDLGPSSFTFLSHFWARRNGLYIVYWIRISKRWTQTQVLDFQWRGAWINIFSLASRKPVHKSFAGTNQFFSFISVIFLLIRLQKSPVFLFVYMFAISIELCINVKELGLPSFCLCVEFASLRWTA